VSLVQFYHEESVIIAVTGNHEALSPRVPSRQAYALPPLPLFRRDSLHGRAQLPNCGFSKTQRSSQALKDLKDKRFAKFAECRMNGLAWPAGSYSDLTLFQPLEVAHKSARKTCVANDSGMPLQ
jgi:hypothetical protein